MKNRLGKFLFCFLIGVVLTGCWQQEDTIRIKSDGTTTFESLVTMTDDSMSLKDAEGLTSDFMKSLQNAGWKVEKKLLSEKKPIKYKFSGQGNIRQVKNVNDSYRIEKVDEKNFTITFSSPSSKKGRGKGEGGRSIRFDQPFFGGARILDAQGKKVDSIPEVSRDLQ